MPSFTHYRRCARPKAFGFRIGLIRRWMRASATSIASGIDDSRRLIETNDFDGFRKVIDIRATGRTIPPPIWEAARQAAGQGRSPSMACRSWRMPRSRQLLRERVIIGASAFIEPARLMTIPRHQGETATRVVPLGSERSIALSAAVAGIHHSLPRGVSTYPPGSRSADRSRTTARGPWPWRAASNSAFALARA
ncbi:MAG: DUF1194 domain-containing protein [Rhodospirillaceae bacterium]|nr:DUF1194 domain-containing protein [Rhodospirillaceae bacterium]